MTLSLVRTLAAGRVVFGGAMLVAPEQAVRGWIGPATASRGGTQVVTQAFGARDLVLGAGALAAFARGGDGRDWVLAGALCDLVDLVATLKGDDIPVAGRVIVALLASGAIGVSAAYLAAGSGDGPA